MRHCRKIKSADKDDLVQLFRHASRLMARKYHRHQHHSHAQRHIYYLIRESGPMPQKELMDQLGVRSASLSEILAKMEKQGLITRQRNEKDKRGFIVSINEKNGHMEAEGRERVNQSIFSCLDEVERNQLTGLLTKIIENVEQDRSAE